MTHLEAVPEATQACADPPSLMKATACYSSSGVPGCADFWVRGLPMTRENSFWKLEKPSSLRAGSGGAEPGLRVWDKLLLGL